MTIQQITIVGTGLIGGSFGLALRQHGFEGTIVGCDKPEVLEAAVMRGAIDRGETDLKEAVLHSDVVMFATPVGAILSLFEKLAPTLSPATLITDTGSTKRAICRACAHDLWSGRRTAGTPRASHGRQGTRRDRERRAGPVSRRRVGGHAHRPEPALYFTAVGIPGSAQVCRGARCSD